MNGRNGENELLRLFRIASNRNWIVRYSFIGRQASISRIFELLLLLSELPQLFWYTNIVDVLKKSFYEKNTCRINVYKKKHWHSIFFSP